MFQERGVLDLGPLTREILNGDALRVLQCVTACCSVLQFVAVCCSVL